MNTAPSVSAAVEEFFISRAGADRAIAQVIAEIIREAGGKPYFQEEFGHGDFMRRMEQGYERMARMVALLSPEYQRSEHCRAEYNHVLGKDPNNLKERLIVLKVVEGEAEGNLQNIPRTNLVPVLTDMAALRRVVRVALGFEKRESEIAFSQPYRLAGQQIRHPEVRPPKDFTGREDMLTALGDKLWQGRSTVAIRNSSETTLALRGLGGVGKTVLAQAYAWNNRDRYHGVWWVRADKRETLIDDLVALGKRFIPGLGAQEPEDAAQTTLDRIAQMRTEKPWLLVYDNVDDQATIRRLTPADNAHVLITTRLTEWHGEADQLPVDVFDRETAIEFLLAQARNKDQQRDAAGRLADALQRLPLALSHARSYCRERNWSFDQYAARLPELIRRKPKGAEYPDTVFATFSLAIEKAAEECADAERLMGLLALFAPDQVPLWLIREDVLDQDRLGDALAALNGVSLVTLENLPDGAPGVSVHRLVQEAMRGRLSEAGTLAEVAAEATRLVDAAYDGSKSFDALLKNTRLLPVALAVLAHAPRQGAPAWHTLSVLLQTGVFRQSRWETSLAQVAFREACGIAERLASVEPRNAVWQSALLASQRCIGHVLMIQGCLSGALESLRTALAIAERLVSADPGNADWQRDLSLSHNMIGDVLLAQGDLAQALTSYHASLSVADRLAKAEPSKWQRDLSLSHNKIGDVLLAQGDLVQALTSYQASLAIVDRLAKAEPRNAEWQFALSNSLDNIGNVLRAQGKLSAALESYRASFAVRDHCAKEEPHNAEWQSRLSHSHNRLGALFQVQGNLAAALESYRASISITERITKADPHNAQLKLNLALVHASAATVLARQGDREEALRGFRQGRAIVARLMEQSPDNATLPKHLAWFDDQISKAQTEDAPRPGSTPATTATAPNGRGWLSRILGRG